jgi:hypothetical protein
MPRAALLAFALLALPGCLAKPAPIPENYTLEARLRPFRPLIGMGLPEAERWLQRYVVIPPGVPGWPIRVIRPVCVDGVPLFVTMDEACDRIDVVIEDGRVVDLVDLS